MCRSAKSGSLETKIIRGAFGSLLGGGNVDLRADTPDAAQFLSYVCYNSNFVHVRSLAVESWSVKEGQNVLEVGEFY